MMVEVCNRNVAYLYFHSIFLYKNSIDLISVGIDLKELGSAAEMFEIMPRD